jgi:Fic/DOC family
MTDFLDLEDLLDIARATLGWDPEVRDYGLLESALARPRASVFGRDAYPELHLKAAALLHSLARNHALVDGNKRMAWTACRTFSLSTESGFAHRRMIALKSSCKLPPVRSPISTRSPADYAPGAIGRVDSGRR